MDEQTLSILLECPVCLNTLSESSRVLPCQHTFCSECLEDILGRRGNLQCPECRTVVTTSIDHLPRNILLMRLLESLKTRRNSNVHLTLNEKPGESGTNRCSKSTPCTPDYSSSSSSFSFLLPYQPQRRASDSDQSPSLVETSSPADQTSPTPQPVKTLHRRTSAVIIVPQPPEVTESNRRHHGLRTSRTATDLVSLSNSQSTEFTGAVSSDRDRYVPTQLPAPTISLTDAPRVIPQQQQQQSPVPLYLDNSLFNQANWRQSPRNRSLPSNSHHPADVRLRTESPNRAVPVGRTASYESRSIAVGDAPAQSQGPAQPPSYRAWMPHPILDAEQQHRGPIMELVFSAQPGRPGSQGVFNQRTQVKPPASVQRFQEAVPVGRSTKESRSFIKTLFGGNKNQTSGQNLTAQKFTSLSGSDQDRQNGIWHVETRSTIKPCITTTFRSAATRHSSTANNKPVNFECYRCVTPYPAKNHYELDLNLNDLLYVHQKHSDGWMKATHERTGRNGLIPVAFVERLHGSGISS